MNEHQGGLGVAFSGVGADGLVVAIEQLGAIDRAGKSRHGDGTVVD